MARLLEKYRSEILPALKDELKRGNVMDVPRIEKICLNMGVGKAIDDSKLLDTAVSSMATISGQAPAVTKAKKSVSNFRLRTGYKIGCRVTLRGAKMYEFLDRLVSTAIPRIRDFQGLKRNSFDKNGNYSLGIEEVTIFPEIDPDKIDQAQGMDVTVVIKNSKGADESRRLLALLGMPFEGKDE